MFGIPYAVLRIVVIFLLLVITFWILFSLLSARYPTLQPLRTNSRRSRGQ